MLPAAYNIVKQQGASGLDSAGTLERHVTARRAADFIVMTLSTISRYTSSFSSSAEDRVLYEPTIPKATEGTRIWQFTIALST